MVKQATRKKTVAKTSKTPVRSRKRTSDKSVEAVAAPAPAEYRLPDGHVLCLRTCDENLKSYHGEFQWPESGECFAPDWVNDKGCGSGLHGLLWGSGSGELLNWGPGCKWLVVEVPKDPVVDLGGKVKFPRCRVVFCGGQVSATNFLAKFAPDANAIVGVTASATGYRGTASATGDRGTASATGDRGTASATGYRGTASAGESGVLQLAYWDSVAQRKRIVTKYVGEDGVEVGRKYTIDERGQVSAVRE